MWAQLTQRALVLGAGDLWIAATALPDGFTVVTRSVGESERVPRMRVLATVVRAS